MRFSTFSRKQLKILTWWAHPIAKRNYDAIIADGAIRSGKTLSMSVSFMLWAMRNFDEENFAICGKTVESCNRNVIVPLINAIGTLMGFKQIKSKNYIQVNFAGHSNRFYIFGGKDEGSAALIQGITLAGVLLDEVALMPRSFVEQALARCSVEGSRFWFNCNPDNPQHWFYIEWIKKHQMRRALYLHFTMDDNPSLSDKTKQRYQNLYSGAFYERFIRGNWVAAEGVIYSMFDPEIHCYDELSPGAVTRSTTRIIACDYGTINPCVFLDFLIEPNGAIHLDREYYYNSRAEENGGKMKTDEEYYRDLESFVLSRRATWAQGQEIGEFLVEPEMIIIDPSAASFKECIRHHGRFAVRDADNEVLDGIRRVGTALQTGRLKVSRKCKSTIGEFQSYVWDEKSPVDKPVKANDHAMDALRYFINTIYERRWGV
ncbi:PBSX family phage terminase large subunit [Anaerotruncus rubiinfantis]|uniref:PBSX family phage terminase large subunit n=1 Tax=Anaerotruncus rubiinfantis TaxID=1720200 RepID=UPI003D7AA872